MKRQESKWAINCNPEYGPIFGGDILIAINNKLSRCSIYNSGERGYECHTEYKSSLFVNTAGPDEMNKFAVLDYEVYCINNYKDYIYKLCKHPDIMMEYIETNDISEESLKQIDDDVELLSDLDAIHCDDSNIRLKISRYYFKNPSKFLPNTHIVDKKYDSYLRKWVGDNKWKLLYRSSEHEYTTESFHEFCDNKGPTLIVIKSSGGWIFGGFTTKSWSGDGI